MRCRCTLCRNTRLKNEPPTASFAPFRLPLCAALMVASNHRRLGGVSLLLLAASFAFLQQTQAFYDSPSRVSDLLGDHQVRVNQDGYVDYAETRVNIYGERSSVAYRYKPHFEKLKLRVDHSCFSVKSLDGKVVLQAKNDLIAHSCVTRPAGPHFIMRLT